MINRGKEEKDTERKLYSTVQQHRWLMERLLGIERLQRGPLMHHVFSR